MGCCPGGFRFPVGGGGAVRGAVPLRRIASAIGPKREGPEKMPSVDNSLDLVGFKRRQQLENSRYCIHTGAGGWLFDAIVMTEIHNVAKGR